MNDRIKELIKQSYDEVPHERDWDATSSMFNKEKFAELIIQECVNTIQSRAPGQLGKAGEGWTNGYDDGLKTGAFLIKQQFGVKE